MSLNTAVIQHIRDNQYEIRGVLDFDSVPLLVREIKKMLKNQTSANINFKAVTHSNSAGLALLFELARFMRGKTLQFTQLSAQMNEFAKAYGVSEELIRLSSYNKV